MKDDHDIKANTARSQSHPMTAPSDSLKTPPAIIVGGAGIRITDIDGHEVVDGVGGLWNVHLGYSCQPIKVEVVGDVRGGSGRMHGVALVADRASTTPADKAVPGKVQAAAHKAGAMIPASGNNIILSPPLILSEAGAGVILSVLDTGLASV